MKYESRLQTNPVQFFTFVSFHFVCCCFFQAASLPVKNKKWEFLSSFRFNCSCGISFSRQTNVLDFKLGQRYIPKFTILYFFIVFSFIYVHIRTSTYICRYYMYLFIYLLLELYFLHQNLFVFINKTGWIVYLRISKQFCEIGMNFDVGRAFENSLNMETFFI